MGIFLALVFVIIFLWLANKLFAFLADVGNKVADRVEGNNPIEKKDDVNIPQNKKRTTLSIVFIVLTILIFFIIVGSSSSVIPAIAFLSLTVFFAYLFAKYSHRWKKEAHLFRGEEHVTEDLVKEYLTIGGAILAIFLLFAGPIGWILCVLIVLWIIFVVNRKKDS